MMSVVFLLPAAPLLLPAAPLLLSRTPPAWLHPRASSVVSKAVVELPTILVDDQEYFYDEYGQIEEYGVEHALFTLDGEPWGVYDPVTRVAEEADFVDVDDDENEEASAAAALHPSIAAAIDPTAAPPTSAEESPLHMCVTRGDTAGVAWLLDHGALVDLATSALHETPLHVAADLGQVDLLRQLLERRARVHVVDVDGDTPLHIAARHADALSALLAAGAEIDARNRFGDTPLHAAVWVGDPKAVEVLVRHGASVSARGDSGQTPREIAVLRGHGEAVTRILDAAADDARARDEGAAATSTVKELDAAAAERASDDDDDGMHVTAAATRIGDYQHPARPPPDGLGRHWTERAKAMPPTAAALLVHGDPVHEACAARLLVEGGTCSKLTQ